MPRNDIGPDEIEDLSMFSTGFLIGDTIQKENITEQEKNRAMTKYIQVRVAQEKRQHMKPVRDHRPLVNRKNVIPRSLPLSR